MMRPPPRALLPTSLAEQLAALSIGVSTKRKQPTGVTPGRKSHYGLSNDSSASLATVALSRLAQARDEAILQPLALAPTGASLLAQLKAAVLRLAVTVGGPVVQ